MPLLPINPHISLGELAYTSLKQAILQGHFSAGQKLTVRKVAHALGVSTTPARDAIVRLIGEGALVNTGPKTVIVPSLTLATLDELTSIRLLLEGLAARTATELIASEQLDALKAVQLKINAALDEGNCAAALSANKSFHFLVYETAQMPRLVSMVDSIWVRTEPCLSDPLDFSDFRIRLRNHVEALVGLENGDKVRVQAAIEQDIHDEYRHLAKRLRERQRR
ncbi:GntR family transcriptional regulator [Bradyrhizobium sp. CW7]|nr:GntR family transcriptional regulator [Bradyrhizobium sp. CW7]